jgi:hypothetical protein
MSGHQALALALRPMRPAYSDTARVEVDDVLAATGR